jgi:hypothetical protein
MNLIDKIKSRFKSQADRDVDSAKATARQDDQDKANAVMNKMFKNNK